MCLSVVVIVVVTTKIARSRHLGNRATCKHKQSHGLVPALALGHVLSAHAHNWPGRGRQHYRPISVQKAADARHTQGIMCALESYSLPAL